MNQKTNYRTLRVILNSHCNLDCFYCCGEGYESKYSILNSENIQTLALEAKDLCNIRKVKFTGGEPFLFKDFHCIFENAVKDLKNLNCSLITNGYYTSKITNLIDRINRKNNFSVTISLPSIDHDKFDAMVGNSRAFSRVIKTINWFREKRLPLKINCVVAKGITDNLNITNMIEYFKKDDNFDLRFLQLRFNRVNQQRITHDYYLCESTFTRHLRSLGFSLIAETRSTNKYMDENTGYTVSYIKAFCSNDCTKCPEDKTSLWLTPDGKITNCIQNIFTEYQQIKYWDSENIRLVLNKLIMQ